MDEKRKELISLMEEVENSPERALFMELEALRVSYRVFMGNYREFVGLLSVVENPIVAIHLKDAKRRLESHMVLEEVSRLLHNFLASAESLVGHTRTHVENLYEGQPFHKEYHAKKDEHFKANPLRRFVQDLRVYTQHVKLTLPSSILEYKRGQNYQVTYGAVITSELRKWDNWSPLGRQYLESFPVTLPLKQLARDYFALVAKFYKWLDEREREVNSERLERLRQMLERLASLTREDQT